MSVAILTKYLGPTNFRPARIVAQAENGSHGRRVVVSWDDALSVEQNHTMAAQKLAHKFDWAGHWVGGGTQAGYAFVCVERTFNAEFTVRRMDATQQAPAR